MNFNEVLARQMSSVLKAARMLRLAESRCENHKVWLLLAWRHQKYHHRRQPNQIINYEACARRYHSRDALSLSILLLEAAGMASAGN